MASTMQRLGFAWRIQDEKSPPCKAKLDAAASPTTTIVVSTPTCFLRILPPELKGQVFKYLDPVTSICLGLTCKEMYAFHRRFRPYPIPLLCYIVYQGVAQYLTTLLYTWFGPDWVMVVKKSIRYNTKAVTLTRMPVWVKEGLEKEDWDEGRGWCYTEVDLDRWNVMNWVQTSGGDSRVRSYGSFYEK